MGDFFESGDTATFAAVDREMRRQELRRTAQRKTALGVVSVALAGTLLLGGGFAAFAATHRSAPKKPVAVSKSHKSPKKTKKHKHV